MSDPHEDRESAPFLLERLSRPSLPREVPSGPGPRSSPRSRPPPAPAPVGWAATLARSGALGQTGLLIALVLILVAIFADLLASDAPLLCRSTAGWLALPAVSHAPVPADVSWRVDPIVVAAGPRVPTGRRLEAPSRAHPFGTDREGRDVFARVVHGTRSYLVFALAAVLAASAFGALLGGIAGVWGGVVDSAVGRALESISAFPPLVLVLGVQAAVPRPSLLTLFLAIAATRWPEIARLVRGEVLHASARDYAVAARALGATPLRVLRRHLLPNVLPPLVVAASASVGAVVLTEASLDFLGVGTPLGAASWGETMSEFRAAPHAYWLLAFPGALLVLTVSAYQLMGEALREWLDPRAG